MPALFSYRDGDLYSHHSLDHDPRPDSFSMHAHEWMEVLYFLSGSGSCLVEGTLYPLQQGDILLMRAAETHKLEISPDAPYERIAIHFSAGLLTTLDPEGKLLRPFLERPLGRDSIWVRGPLGEASQASGPKPQFHRPDLKTTGLREVGQLSLVLTVKL